MKRNTSPSVQQLKGRINELAQEVWRIRDLEHYNEIAISLAQFIQSALMIPANIQMWGGGSSGSTSGSTGTTRRRRTSRRATGDTMPPKGLHGAALKSFLKAQQHKTRGRRAA